MSPFSQFIQPMSRFSRLTIVSIGSSVLVALMSGCGENSSPTAPPPAVAPSLSVTGTIYGTVISTRNGQCLAGATIELLDGPRPGERVVQSAAVCDSLDGFESINAFIFRELTSDKPVTLRASMPGYEPRTVALAIVPNRAYDASKNAIIRLDPAP